MQDYIFSNDFFRNIDAMIYTCGYEADRTSPWSYTWIGMQGIKVKEYLERTSLLDSLVVHYGQDDQMRLCHEKMFEADKLPQNRDLIINSIMYEYLFLLASKFPSNQFSVNEKKSDYVEEALKYIEAHYCDPITIQEIADHLNINRSYLHRIFKSFTGFSIQSYLVDYRIRQACILLKNTDLSIRVIAHSVSYADSLYFSRILHEKMGVNPNEYRNARDL